MSGPVPWAGSVGADSRSGLRGGGTVSVSTPVCSSSRCRGIRSSTSAGSPAPVQSAGRSSAISSSAAGSSTGGGATGLFTGTHANPSALPTMPRTSPTKKPPRFTPISE